MNIQTPRFSRWRALGAIPFVLAFVLAFFLGPQTIDSQYVSAGELALLSVIGILLMLAAPRWLLIPTGLVMFAVFPPLAGVGFYHAPNWAVFFVALCFYGSIAATAGAAIGGLGSMARGIVRRINRLSPMTSRVRAAAGVSLTLLLVISPVPSVSAAAVGAVNLGGVINTSARDAEPSFTADGRTMYFNCHSTQICVSHLTGTWETGRWSTPQTIGSPISTAYEEVEPLINPAGDQLYITSNRPFGSGAGMPGLSLYVMALWLVGWMTDAYRVSLFGGLGHEKVWVSHLLGGSWSTPENLNNVAGQPPMNGPFNNHCLFVSQDANEAFWTSDRPGGFGQNDIWTSRRINGRWTAPTNLGPTVNSAANEHHAMLGPEGNSLYVTSDRAGGHGGEDIYVSKRGADDNWSALVDLPSPINGPGNDRCPVLTPDNRIFVFDSDRSGGYGSKDLWWVYFSQVSPNGMRDSWTTLSARADEPRPVGA